MNATISAAIANQRHAELVAQAEARRAVASARIARNTRPATDGQGSSLPLRRRPMAAVFSWIAAGQL